MGTVDAGRDLHYRPVHRPARARWRTTRIARLPGVVEVDGIEPRLECATARTRIGDDGKAGRGDVLPVGRGIT